MKPLCSNTARMTVDDYKTLVKKESKYRNKKTIADGIIFDSLKEARRYKDLVLLVKAGEITALQVHCPMKLKVNGIQICTYKADFLYWDVKAAKLIIEDVKSPITRKNPVYRLKNKLIKAIMGIDILET